MLSHKTSPTLQTPHLATVAHQCRHAVLEMLTKVNSSHIGSCFSIIDILTVLYHSVVDTEKIRTQQRDRDYIILSKGHAASALYAVLASAKIMPETLLENYNMGPLGGHPTRNSSLGIETSTGSLGQGLPVGVGIAWATKQDHLSTHVYVLVGDGECQEGAIWEAIMMASRLALSNLTVIVDYNKIQSLTYTDSLMPATWLNMFSAAGCTVKHVDGHDHNALADVFNRNTQTTAPTVIIAHTIKGKGVDFMENKIEWHYKSCNAEQFEVAKSYLDKDLT